jgi:hypothetical protein
MPGFASRDDIITEISTNGKRDEWTFYKTTTGTPVVGQIETCWLSAGNPGAGVAPATTPGTILESDATTQVAGSMWFPDRSTDLRFLLAFGALSSQNGSLILYDRLAHVGGVTTSASTGAKTVNSATLTRYNTTATATNNECWLEVTTAHTTNSLTANLNQYTSGDGTTGQSGGTLVTTVANSTIGKIIPMPLSATKAGILSVQAGVNVGGTAPAAGVCNVLIVRRLATIPLLANIWNEVSFLDDVLSLPQIYDNASLALAWVAGSTTAPIIQGKVTCAYG